MKKGKTTNVELNNTDCAIIFRESGQCELLLPRESASDEVTSIELLASGLVTFLRDPKFVEMIKSEFIKNIQAMENKTVAKDDKPEEKDSK
jgi:hypothetical protein